MAPNVLGNTLLLAEACIEQEDRSNNNNASIGTQQYKNKSFLNVAPKPAPVAEDLKPKEATKDAKVQETSTEYHHVYVWRNIIAFIYLHLGFLYGSYLLVTSAKWSTIIFELWSTLAIAQARRIRRMRRTGDNDLFYERHRPVDDSIDKRAQMG
uniref:Uncharacterized protein n=1 Tax=Anopheles epiroticus TaxID=199890 RepID=A0A182PS54_9DIPT